MNIYTSANTNFKMILIIENVIIDPQDPQVRAGKCTEKTLFHTIQKNIFGKIKLTFLIK